MHVWFTSTTRQNRLQLLGAAITYAVLTAVLLRPLLVDIGGKVAGYDYFHFNWNFWWIRHALDAGSSIYETNHILFPFVTNLSYHTLSVFWYPLWALAEPLIGTIAAVNLIIVLGCWLNGYLTFIFLRSEKITYSLALLGGAALQTLPTVRYFLFNTHLNLLAWFWLSVQLLVWQRIIRAITGDPRRAILWTFIQGVSLAIMLLTDLQWGIFLAFIFIPYGLLTLWQVPYSRHRILVLMASLISVTYAVIVLWFVGLLPSMMRFEGTLAPRNVNDRPGIPFPEGFLRVLDQWWEWNHPSIGGFITLAVISALLVNFWQRYSIKMANRTKPSTQDNTSWVWFLIMLPPLILSIGPFLTIGDQRIPMPYQLLYALTSGLFWMPWRLAPVFAFAAIVFAGKSLTSLVSNWSVRQQTVFMVIATLLLAWTMDIFTYAPTADAPPQYGFYESIRHDKADDYAVIEVPVAAGTGEVILGDLRAVELQYYGIIHERRMINGFVARAPLEHIWWLNTDHALMSWLGQRRPLDRAAAEAELRRLNVEWSIGYFVIHQALIGRENPANEEILAFFNAMPDVVCPIWVEQSIVVYRTSVHPAGCPPRLPGLIDTATYEINLGDAGDEMFLGSGWYHQEEIPGTMVRWLGAGNSDNKQGVLYVDLPPANYRLEFFAQAFYEERLVQVEVNGVAVGGGRIPAETFQMVSVYVPATVIGAGQHIEVVLLTDGTSSPHDNLGVEDRRNLSIMVDWVRFQKQN